MTVDVQAVPESSIDADTGHQLSEIGIEYEYPVATDAAHAPATSGATSTQLRNEVGVGTEWLTDPEYTGIPAGAMGRDHTGAEIRSDILDLHLDEPSAWYRGTTEKACELGYPTAGCGRGDTSFGCHLHLSSMTEEQRDAVNEIAREPWGRLFFCCSITSDSVDPWRHNGVAPLRMDPDSDVDHGPLYERTYGSPGHYEFRLVEPVLPDHFDMIISFLRELEYRGPEAARQYAYEKVHEPDPRLTPVKQYRLYEQRIDEWPSSVAISDSRRTDRHMAEYVVDLMESAN